MVSQVQNAGPQGQRVPIVGPYFLVSFDPSSGIGVYEYLEVTHRFDVLPGASDRTGKKLHPESQTDAGIYFNSLNELLSVCRREYLRDKKNTCYSTLFTTQSTKAVCARMLQFLNEPRLSGITASRIVVSILREVADVTLVAAVIVLAHKMQLQNVEECLATEFQDIVFAQATTEHLKVSTEAADQINVKLREHRERKANPPLSPTAPERW